MTPVSPAHASTGRAPAPFVGVVRDDAETGRSVYRALTGQDAAEARIDTDRDFDAHVLAAIIAAAAMEDGSLSQRVGLSEDDLNELVGQWFPRAELGLSGKAVPAPPDDELAMVRDLLLTNRSTQGETGRWLAHMVARRSMEPSHLWEDLGLRNRDELSRMLKRHFAPLAERNTRGMRWKRFFYRLLCEDEGFVMCATPVCTDCCDFDNCFGAEDGESRLARRRLEAELALARQEARP